jgi:hypothetical protein
LTAQTHEEEENMTTDSKAAITLNVNGGTKFWGKLLYKKI